MPSRGILMLYLARLQWHVTSSLTRVIKIILNVIVKKKIMKSKGRSSKLFLSVVLLATLFVSSFFYFKNEVTKPHYALVESDQEEYSSREDRAYGCNSRPTLRYGSKGKCVKRAQARLKHHGYKIAVDGEFGSKTRAAVKKFQKKKHLTVDGIIGKKTWAKLLKKK